MRLPQLPAPLAILLSGALLGTLAGCGSSSPSDAGPAGAEAADAEGTPADDPPARVARLSHLSGSVSVRPASAEEWSPAALNEPLTSGDRLWTDRGARAELEVGTGALRVGPETSLDLLRVEDDAIQVRVPRGSITVSLRELSGGETFEVATPAGAVTLRETGRYLVEVSDSGSDVIVRVRAGGADVTAGGAEFPVPGGKEALVADGDPPVYDIADARAPDELERWSEDRERRAAGSASLRYVSSGVVGYEDLDASGTWRTEPEYGAVWVPTTVAADWAPYRYGRWRWTYRWGWTWVDDASWGFAPFHYGRWAYLGRGWAWVPGVVVARPVFAPALVGWVGGGGWSASVGIGAGVGWFPLGPRDVWVPGYRHSSAYIRRVNVANVNVTNFNVRNVSVTNVYVNRGVAGAVTAVPRDVFTGARSVRPAMVVVPPRALGSAPTATMAAVPPRAESLGIRGSGAVPRPPAAVEGRAVRAKLTAPPAPVSFSQQQSVLATREGRPLDRATAASLRRSAPASSASAPAVKPATAPSRSGATLVPKRDGIPVARPVTASPATRREPEPKREAAPREPRRERTETRPAERAPERKAEPAVRPTPASERSRPAETRTEPKPAERAPQRAEPRREPEPRREAAPKREAAPREPKVERSEPKPAERAPKVDKPHEKPKEKPKEAKKEDKPKKADKKPD